MIYPPISRTSNRFAGKEQGNGLLGQLSTLPLVDALLNFPFSLHGLQLCDLQQTLPSVGSSADPHADVRFSRKSW